MRVVQSWDSQSFIPGVGVVQSWDSQSLIPGVGVVQSWDSQSLIPGVEEGRMESCPTAFYCGAVGEGKSQGSPGV
jgi:hypothetical protein